MPLPAGAAVPDVPGFALPTGARARPAIVLFFRIDCAASEVSARVLPRFRAIPGLLLVAVSQDPDAETRSFAKENGWDAGWVLLDRDPWPASLAWDVRTTPTWYLVDGSGKVAATVEGWDRAAVNALAVHAARIAGSASAVVSPPGGDEPDLRPG